MVDEPEPKASNVRQVSGPGVPGMESEAPLYHLDVDGDHILELIRDPVGFLRDLGLGPDQGVAPDGGMSVHFSSPHRVWYGGAWRLRDELPPATADGGVPVKACCWVHDDEVWCRMNPVVV